MASRFIQAAIPTYKESYVPLPLEFINKQITQDQAGFDKGAAEIAALSSLKQNMSPWAEEQGYRDKLMNPYLAKINELSNQLYSTGQVGQVVPQIAKLNQQWTNDEQRLALEKDYEFYNETYLPWTKSDKYSASFDELRQYQNGVKTEKWNPNIDIKTSSGLARIEGDQDAYVSKQLDNFVASGFQGVSGKDGIEIVMVGGVPQIRQTIPGTTGYKVIDPSDKMYGHYYEDAIQNVTDAIMSGQDNPHRYYKGVYNQGDEASTRAAIEERVRQLASTRYFKTVENTPERVTYNNLPAGGSGADGAFSGSGEDYLFDVTPVSSIDFSYDPKTIEQFVVDTDKQILNKRIGLDDFARQALESNPELYNDPLVQGMFNNLNTSLNKDLQTRIDNGDITGDDAIAAQNIIKSGDIDFNDIFFGAKDNAANNILKERIGEKAWNNLRAEMQGSLLEMSKNPSQKTYGFAQEYFKKSEEIQNLEAQKTMSNTLNDIMTDDLIKQASDKGLLGSYKDDEATIKALKYFMKNPNEVITTDSDEEFGVKVKNFFREEDLKPKRGGLGEQAYWNWIRDMGMKIKSELKPNLSMTETFSKVVDITGGKDEADKKKSLLSQWTTGLKDRYNSSNTDLLQVIQHNILDPSIGNVNKIEDAFDRTPIKEKGFEWQDGKMQYTDVSFGKLSGSNMPVMFITVKNTDTDKSNEAAGKTATITTGVDMSDKFKVGQVVQELLLDNDPKVKTFGAELFAQTTLDEGTINKLKVLTDIRKSDAGKGKYIEFTSGSDNMVANIDSYGKVQLNIVTGKNSDGTPIYTPIVSTKTLNGTVIKGDAINSMNELLQFIGFYKLGKAESNTGTSGGSSNVPYQGGNPFQ